MTDLASIAKSLRRRVVQMHHDAKVGHLASCLSAADIIAALYWSVLQIDPNKPDDPNRDRFILSKGHAASLLYSALAYKGYFPPEWLYEFGRNGSALAEHPPACGPVPGVEFGGGSLGHGGPVAVGMALSGRMTGKDYRVFCLLSDGDTQEGSTWEAAAFAGQHLLRRLCFVIDANGFQGIRRAPDGPASLAAKFEAFGWKAEIVDGHDPDVLVRHLRTTGSHVQPLAIVARTVKGRGISFMESDGLLWHYRVPDKRELELALAELE